MTMVSEYSWESNTWTHNNGENAARAAWRQSVQEVAEKAHEKLPECNGRIDSAVKLVLAGDVELLADGTAKVASQSNGKTQYVVGNGACECRDYRDSKAPHQLCKHRLGAAIARRAQDLLKSKLGGASTNGQVTAAPDPEPLQADAPEPAQAAAPQDTPQGVPAQYVVLIQGRPFVKFAGLLKMAHDRGLVALTADWIYNDAELSLAHAVATFQDGRRFEESGDASPGNVTRMVAVHFRRVALTRAKARVLRDALGIDLVAVEELADE